MEYINDININEAIIHILDSNGEEPVLNEYSLELDEDIYKFLYKHIEKCLKDDELKYARFNPERNIVKEVVQDYLNETSLKVLNTSDTIKSTGMADIELPLRIRFSSKEDNLKNIDRIVTYTSDLLLGAI